MALHMVEKKWNSGEMKHNIRFPGFERAKRGPVLPAFSLIFTKSVLHMQVCNVVAMSLQHT